MPDNGLTIDGLNSVSAITANDEIPVWDAEAAPNEPTKKITGSNLASSVKTLGSLLDTSDVVDNLTSTATDKPLAAAQGKALNDNLVIRSSYLQDAPTGTPVNAIYYNDYFAFITYTSASKVWSEGDSFGTIPNGMRPVATQRATGNMYANNIGVQIRIDTNGNVTFDSKTSVDGRISFTVMYVVK